MHEFDLVDWILTIAAIVVSWQIHASAVHHLPGATSAEPSTPKADGGVMLPVGEASTATDMLERIRLAGGYPDLAAFLAGASLAYEQTVGAFADGELQPVAGLLGPAVRQAFTEAIAERRSRGETLSTMVIGVKAEPVAAGLDSGTAWIEVRFATEMVSATVDREGRVLAGDPRRVIELSEAWTFARDVRSTDPNWMLVATDEDA